MVKKIVALLLAGTLCGGFFGCTEKPAVSVGPNEDLTVDLPSKDGETVKGVSPIPGSVEELKQMVQSVNATEVSDEDFLSDNLYFYNKETEEISKL
jgi:hypothetical protein